MTINPTEKQIEIDNKSLVLPYDKISDSDWGYIYEKYVGQIFEDDGYSVQYIGLELGYRDGGIDLIASKDNEVYYIQCKFGRSIITKRKIDKILSASSNRLYKVYQQNNKKINFMLILPNKNVCFSKRIEKNFRLTFTEASQIEYPILQYYLDYNHVQDRAILLYREIPMEK